MKYRKRPVVIEAWQFTDENKDQVLHDLQAHQMNISHTWKDGNPAILIPTLEGEMTASLGDYIIKGINGEFYPCKPDIFAKTYEAETAPPMTNKIAEITARIKTVLDGQPIQTVMLAREIISEDIPYLLSALTQAQRERDAAVEDMEWLAKNPNNPIEKLCEKWSDNGYCCYDDEKIKRCTGWQWRGSQEEAQNV